jgi:hypothetical protein
MLAQRRVSPIASPSKQPVTRSLRAVRVSRCVRDRLDGGGRGVVLGIQRRACWLAVGDGSLVILSTPDVPLAPNGLAVDVADRDTLAGGGLRAGQVVALAASAPPDPAADWLVALDAASTWEPRPRVDRIVPRDLVDRLRTARATVVADGAGESLLPLLWASGAAAGAWRPGLVAAAGVPARLLCAAAVRGDAASAARAARGLAGLGPGLTPSGDDLLAGFAAAWILVGDSLGLDGVARERVMDGIVGGARRGASPLGRAWLEHARRGELLEPMTRFVAALLAAEARDLAGTVRGALEVGSSSGTDWMVGLLLASAAIVDAATPGRSTRGFRSPSLDSVSPALEESSIGGSHEGPERLPWDGYPLTALCYRHQSPPMTKGHDHAKH